MKTDTKILRGMKNLVDHDHYLLDIDVSEQAITHRLALHCERLYKKSEYRVDCEWDKNGRDPKLLSIDPGTLLERIKAKGARISNTLDEERGVYVSSVCDGSSCAGLKYVLGRISNNQVEIVRIDGETYYRFEIPQNEFVTVKVRPDIIIHERGKVNNLAVIEVKKTTWSTEYHRIFDIIKLSAFLDDRHYQYQRAYFIDIVCGPDFTPGVVYECIPSDIFGPRLGMVKKQ